MDGQFVGKQARVDYIDLFRAFGIICMIMGHIKFGGIFDKWIHAFHMPMFFFVSGWFYKSKKEVPLKARIFRKAKSLLLPYLLFEIVTWLICSVFITEYRSAAVLGQIFWENTYKIPIESGTYGISPVPGAMWFLTAIFMIEAVYLLLEQSLGDNWKLHIAVFILVLIGMFAPRLLPFRLPWAMDAAFVGIGFFHIARNVKKTKAEQLLHLKLWQALLIGVVISASIMVCPKINMRTGNYGWYIPFWINALGAIIAGWNIAIYAEKFCDKALLLKKIGSWLKGIGRNSIVYLCFNQLVILAMTELLSVISIHGIIAKILILIMTMAILFCLEKLICNTKLKVLIGK